MRKLIYIGLFFAFLMFYQRDALLSALCVVSYIVLYIYFKKREKRISGIESRLDKLLFLIMLNEPPKSSGRNNQNKTPYEAIQNNKRKNEVLELLKKGVDESRCH